MAQRCAYAELYTTSQGEIPMWKCDASAKESNTPIAGLARVTCVPSSTLKLPLDSLVLHVFRDRLAPHAHLLSFPHLCCSRDPEKICFTTSTVSSCPILLCPADELIHTSFAAPSNLIPVRASPSCQHVGPPQESRCLVQRCQQHHVAPPT